MSIRVKLILPAAVIVLAAAAVLAWPGAERPGAGWVLAALALALGLQAAVHERWVIAGLRAIKTAVRGGPAPQVHAPEWRDVLQRIEQLREQSCREHASLEQALARSRLTEQALQHSEQRYVLAVRGANDGLWELDLAARQIRLSPRWRHMCGLPDGTESIALADWRDRVHPDDRDDAMQALEAHIGAGTERYEHAHRLRHADGRYRWVLSRGAALRHANGQAWRVVGLDTDITRIKRVECIIQAVADGTAGHTGDAFFHALVRHFAVALSVDSAFITECSHRPSARARTLACWRAGGFEPNFEYELSGTPCERVIREGQLVFHPRGLAQLYACEAGQESYLGLPLFARDGGVIGHLAFVDPEPMPQDMVIESVYRIFTARAAVEIELARALRRSMPDGLDERPATRAQRVA
jgi:PAS domain S-box-containing protein